LLCLLFIKDNITIATINHKPNNWIINKKKAVFTATTSITIIATNIKMNANIFQRISFTIFCHFLCLLLSFVSFNWDIDMLDSTITIFTYHLLNSLIVLFSFKCSYIILLLCCIDIIFFDDIFQLLYNLYNFSLADVYFSFFESL